MLTYAVLAGGVVVNRAIADADFAAGQGWIEAGEAQIGWLYDGQGFTAPPPVPAPVPPVISARQIKLALLASGQFDQIEAFVAQQGREVQIGWEYAVEYLRNDPTLLAMADAFGMKDDQIDDLFRLAVTL